MAVAAVINRKRQKAELTAGQGSSSPSSQAMGNRLQRTRSSYLGTETSQSRNGSIAVGRRRVSAVSLHRSNDLGVPAAEFDDTDRSLGGRDLIYYLFEGFPTPRYAHVYPRWWLGADILGKLNFLLVIASCISFATESLPQFYRKDLLTFRIIEWICVMFFTLDIIVRFSLTREKLQWLRSPQNWIDIISIVPFYVGLGTGGGGGADGLIMFRVLRLLRIFRVLKLSKHNIGLEAVLEALTESSEAISLLAFLLIIALVLFSSAVFFAEQTTSRFDTGRQLWIRTGDGRVSSFQSIFHSMWWCIVTITTVGYGDAVPVSALGKIVGGITMICGVFVIAFPTVILSTNFQEIHQAKVEAQKQVEDELVQYAAKVAEEKELQENAESGAVLGTMGGVGKEPEDSAEEDPAMGDELPTFFQYTFSPDHGSAIVVSKNEDEDTRHDIMIVDNDLAIYEPTLYLQCTEDRNLHVRVEKFSHRSVVTFQLLLESDECLASVEAALAEFRPDRTFDIVARPISKLKAELVSSLPALADVRLMTTSFIEPAGALPLSVLIPSPELVNVLLTNVASLTFKLTLSYDSPSAIEEPLIHYGGMVLGTTTYDEEEEDREQGYLVSGGQPQKG